MSVVSDTPAIDNGARAVLAAAIAKREGAKALLETAHHSASRASQMVAEARAALDAAARASGAAKADLAADVARAASSGFGKASGGIAMREARAAETDAQDALDAATVARNTLADRVAEAEAAFQAAQWDVDAAAKELLAEAAAKLVERVEAAQLALVKDRLALRWFLSQKMVPDWPRASRIMFQGVVPGMHGTPQTAEYEMLWDRMAADNPWQSALTLLKQDATAPLPDLAE